MKSIVTILLPALILAGCLSSAPKAPKYWTVNADTNLKVSEVSVAAPYDGQRFVVLRPDGSVAFDGFNSFSARPVQLIDAAVCIDYSAPTLFVRKLMLDCSVKGERKAVVELWLGEDPQTSIQGVGISDAADGNYSRAFTEAFVLATDKLLKLQSGK